MTQGTGWPLPLPCRRSLELPWVSKPEFRFCCWRGVLGKPSTPKQRFYNLMYFESALVIDFCCLNNVFSANNLIN